MKKVKPLPILLLLLVFASCNAESVPDEISPTEGVAYEEFYELPESESETDVTAEITSFENQESTAVTSVPEPETQDSTEEPVTDEWVEPETEPLEIPPSDPVALTKDTLLEDFDYFTRTLEESFPFYGTARRKFGLDLHRQKNIARAAIEHLDTAKADSQILREFADIISAHIVAPMRTMGHLIGLWSGSSRYDVQLAMIKRDGGSKTPWFPNLYANHLDRMFTSPTAVRYYGNPFESVDIDSYIQSVLVAPATPGNVTFDIIKPDSIAYMRMRGMNSANYSPDGKLIAAFGDTIGDFDHLIIDLRGNQGGSAYNFLDHIVAPLIDEPASLSYYVFFKGGDHALTFDDIYNRDVQWQSENGLSLLYADGVRFPVSDVMPQLTNANADDFASLSYGFKREITVRPAANRWAFGGKIWLLIDGGSYSAAEISAALAKESGFATLVGQPTFGSIGGYTAAFIGLPNTGVIIRYDYGYVTDLHGRSLEEFGVTPNISNRPGMDALSTVLALIEEGNY